MQTRQGSMLQSLRNAEAFLDKHAEKGWTSVEDFRGQRRDRVVAQSQIRRPAGDEYQGGYEAVEGYAAV